MLFKAKVLLLVIVGLSQFLFTLYFVSPGYINIDEAISHWTTKTFHDAGRLDLSNGFDEFPCRALTYPYIHVHDGRLYPIWPYLFPLLAVPLYGVFSFKGLIILNSLSLAGVALFCYLIVLRLFNDRRLAEISCLILLCCTFIWEYSQTALPQITATLFIACSFWLCVCAYFAETRFRAMGFALLSGLTAGFGVGIRIDVTLVFPTIVLFFLFARPWRPPESLMALAGLAPGLSILSAINLVKFGVPNPFSYGAVSLEPMPPLELLLATGLAVAFLWFVTRPTFSEIVERSRLTVILAAVALISLICLTSPTMLSFAKDFVSWGYAHIVDLRFLDDAIRISGSKRADSGAFISGGALRKSLLQSLPFLTVSIIPLVAIFRRTKDSLPLIMLFGVPATFIAYYSYAMPTLNLGGLVLNSRYYVPCLPFFSILAAYSLRGICTGLSAGTRLIAAALGGVAATAAYLFLSGTVSSRVANLDFLILTVPLVMAGALAAVCLAISVAEIPSKRFLTVVCLVLFVGACAHSALVEFLYDYPTHKRWRDTHSFYSQILLDKVPDDCLILTSWDTYVPSVMLIEKSGVRRGLVWFNQWDDYKALLDFHLKSGRRAFGFFQEKQWKELEQGQFKEYAITPLWSHSIFYLKALGPSGP